MSLHMFKTIFLVFTVVVPHRLGVVVFVTARQSTVVVGLPFAAIARAQESFAGLVFGAS